MRDFIARILMSMTFALFIMCFMSLMYLLLNNYLMVGIFIILTLVIAIVVEEFE